MTERFIVDMACPYNIDSPEQFKLTIKIPTINSEYKIVGTDAYSIYRTLKSYTPLAPQNWVDKFFHSIAWSASDGSQRQKERVDKELTNLVLGKMLLALGIPMEEIDPLINKTEGKGYFMDDKDFDEVSNPKHYTFGRKYEPRKVIEDWELDYYLGNAVKYISRAGRKNDEIQDLKKAIQYLKFEIEMRGGNSND